MYFDGTYLKTGSGACVILTSPQGHKLWYMICLHFDTINNVIEYEALVNGFRIAIEVGAQQLMVRRDSKLAIDQFMKAMEPRDQQTCMHYDMV